MINMDHRKIKLIVAVGAHVARLWVLNGFAFCHAAIVATNASCRRALKDTAIMAGFTGDLDVHAL